MEKNNILEALHILVSNNVIGDKQLLSRYKGFRAELFLEDYLLSKFPQYKQLEGGMIISKDSETTSLDNSLYLTVIPEEDFNDDYKKIYNRFSKIGFQKMYLATYSDSDWNKVPIMHFHSETVKLNIPKIEIFEFNIESENFEETSNSVTEVTVFFDTEQIRKRNSHPINESTKVWFTKNMIQFSKNQLLKIYMNRLFLDGYIGFGKKKGKPSDIDMILKTPEGEYRLIEVKEKDLPKQAQKGFGLDIPRLEDLQRISNATKLKYSLVVREINNQEDRNLLGWKYLSIDKFASAVDWNAKVKGGTGMRSSNSYNPTLICPYDLFGDL
ncbi:hypothetical protein [Flavobacterium sp. ZS1P14]|uniref:hypothetical protein n=1 Tax=Flavobacterium sp. ZS1P14 TaxID=3401729 RepID=UPI003AAB9B86